MKNEITGALLRQFLLGKVDDEERERIEILFLTDSSMRERVLAVEQELVEDYLEDSLSPGDREEFRLRYARTAEQQRKLRITKSIKEWAVKDGASEATTGEVNVAERPRASVSLFARLRKRRVYILPIAAVVVLAVVLAVIWVNRRGAQQKHFAIEQELARINEPANLRNVPFGLPTLTLQPGTLRSGPSRAELKLPSESSSEAELRLLWSRENYPAYRAVLLRVSDGEEFKIPNLHQEDDGTIRLRLLTSILTNGQYQLHLTALSSDGSAGETEEYQFTVVE